MSVPFFCLKFKRLSERAAKDTTPEPLSYFAVKLSNCIIFASLSPCAIVNQNAYC